MGTPDFAVPVLAALLDAGHEVVAVYSQPPRPAGRGHRPRLSPVHAFAETRGLEVRTPANFKDAESLDAFTALGLDAAVVAAYGLLLPEAVLKAPRLGCINVHASLLPRWRGAAPIHRAILAGDPESGVTIMQMERGLDTGAMLLKGVLPITAATTGGELHDAVSALGAELIVKALRGLASGQIQPETQPDTGITYAAKLTREETRLDWRLSAVQLERMVRAFHPQPGAWFEHEGERIKVLEAVTEEPGEAPSETKAEPGTVIDDRLGIACGEGVFRPRSLQRAGRGELDAETFLRGHKLTRGTLLPCPATRGAESPCPAIN